MFPFVINSGLFATRRLYICLKSQVIQWVGSEDIGRRSSVHLIIHVTMEAICEYLWGDILMLSPTSFTYQQHISVGNRDHI